MASERKEEEVAMFTRILKTLTIAVAVGALFPIQAAVASPVGEDALPVGVAQKATPVVSEKTAGLYQVSRSSTPVASEITSGLTQVTSSQSSRPLISSEKTTGLFQPLSSPQTFAIASPDNGFDWSDAGIGAGVVVGMMLLGAAGVLTVRRHRGTLAH
jgi:hypothetical protein